MRLAQRIALRSKRTVRALRALCRKRTAKPISLTGGPPSAADELNRSGHSPGRRVRSLAALLCVAVLPQCSCEPTGAPAEQLSYGRFEHVRIYRPAAPAQHLALVVSGDGGWTSGLGALAARLRTSGTLVAGIDGRQLLESLRMRPAGCISPGADLADLARFLDARYALAPVEPIVIGHSAGATLAFLAIAQAPPGTFAGALTLSFCADLDVERPLCPTTAVQSVPRTGGVRLLPAGPLPAPWIALHGLEDRECPAAEARTFAAAIPNARFVALAGVTHRYRDMSRWWVPFEAAYRQLSAASGTSGATVH
jgi:type IV secretory pathway VirJ component